MTLTAEAPTRPARKRRTGSGARRKPWLLAHGEPMLGRPACWLPVWKNVIAGS